MPPIEILTVEEAAERAAPTPSPAKESRSVPRRFYALSLRDHIRLLLPFFVLGAVGVVTRIEYRYWWPANELVYFLADAFIVAMVLGVAFDVFSAKLLVEKISDGLAQALVGRGLPVEMQGPVRDIVSTDLVRDHYVKVYAFSTPESGRVQVSVEVRYEIRNYSEAVRDYAPEMTVESFFRPAFRFLEYGIAGRKIYSFSGENLSSKVETEDDLGVTRVPRSALPLLSLKPIKAGEKAPCQVTWRYDITVPEQYCDVTDLDEATLGATLQVETLPEELEFVSGYDASLHHEAGSQSWYFEKAFIAGQHLRASWFRRKPSLRVSRPSTKSNERVPMP
jgi:hypothetical protein